MASMRSSQPGRIVVGVAEAGRLAAVVKVGSLGDDRLRNEVRMLTTLESARLTFQVPRVLWAGVWEGRFALVTSGFDRTRPTLEVTWSELVDVSLAISQALNDQSFLVHGDFAPWNLLMTPAGIAVVDWEDSRTAAEPLFDLAHYVIRRGSLLGGLHPEAAVGLLTAPQSPGWRYVEQLGEDGSLAVARLTDYLQASGECSSEKERRYRRKMILTLNGPSKP